MGNWTDGNGIHTSGQITSADLDAIANYYRGTFGVSYSSPGSNARIYAGDFNNLRQAILNGAGSAYSVSVPNAVNTNDRIVATSWGVPHANFQPTTYTYATPGTYTLVVPTGANFLSVNQLVGGGGGAHGWWVNIFPYGGQHGALTSLGKTGCSAGSTITIVIGAGGAGSDYSAYASGSAGGNSTVAINGNIVSSAAGGAGGSNNTTYGQSDWTSLYNGYGAGGAGQSNGGGYGNGNPGTGGYASITLYPN